MTRTQLWLILAQIPLTGGLVHDLIQGWREAKLHRRLQLELRRQLGGVGIWRRTGMAIKLNTEAGRDKDAADQAIRP